MEQFFIFGLGYSANRVANRLRSQGVRVFATGGKGDIPFDFADGVHEALGKSSHVLSSIPPIDGRDLVLEQYGEALADKWLGYLSSTGVYGDTKGAWVDETAPLVGSGGSGRASLRAKCDARWIERGARVFRLPGIYGPGRSAFERVASGKAHRIDLPEQIFSRVHVEDIASGVMAALFAPAGAYNLADDLPANQNLVIEEACRLMGIAPPPLVTLEEAGLSPMARGFYAENRRVANSKAKRVLGWKPQYPTYREGLAAIFAAD